MELYDLLDEFADLAPEESLELLIEFGDELPELSAARATEQLDSRHLVKECQSPVYLWTDLASGRAALEAHVTERSPTVRGYVALLVRGISGATIEQVASVPDDLLKPLGLDQTLGMTRRRGFTALLQRIKREIAQAALSQTTLPSG